MIIKEKIVDQNYPCAYHLDGTDYIHPAFMFEQLSMEGETPRRARPRPGTSGSTCSLVYLFAAAPSPLAG